MPKFEVFALKYARRETTSAQQFYGANKGQVIPAEMAYYVWVITAGSRTILFDAGFTEEVATRRGREHIESPIDLMETELGIKRDSVDTIVISHFHNDHTGYIREFDSARYVVQREEMAFWTGPYAGRPAFSDICERDDVLELVRLNLAGRVSVIDGTVDVCDGVSLHLVGGHTPGLQIGAVTTASGTVVLASDAAHYWANVNDDRPSASVTSLPDMYYAFDKLNELASSPELIIPGHDPAVLEQFRAPSESMRGRIVQLA